MTYLIVKAALSGIIVMIVSEVSLRNPTIGGLIASLPLISILAFHLGVARYLRHRKDRGTIRSDVLVHLSVHSDVSCVACSAQKRRRVLGGPIHLLRTHVCPLFSDDMGPTTHRDHFVTRRGGSRRALRSCRR